MSEERASRTTQTREKESRTPVSSWRRPSALPDPDPRKGFVHRWIRVSSLGVTDTKNVSSKRREGWEPVKAEDYPEIDVMNDDESRFPDGIEVGGLVLCRMPEEILEQRKAHFDRLAQSQVEAVDNNYMRESDPRMPLLKPERRSTTSFGKGSSRK